MSVRSPLTSTGVSLPLISTCGGRPTEKFKSEMLSATDSILSRTGVRSKKLILVSWWISILLERIAFAFNDVGYPAQHPFAIRYTATYITFCGVLNRGRGTTLGFTCTGVAGN